MAKKILIPALTIVGFIFLWQAASVVFGIPEWLVPSPNTILKTLISERALIWRNLLVTVIEAIGGFVIGNGIALLAAVMFVHNPSMERVGYPFALALRSIPIVAITPILVLLLGNGWQPKVAIAAIISFFPTLVNMVKGFKAVEANLLELMHVLNATRWKIFWMIRWPTALPFFFASMKISASACVLGAIVAEWIGSSSGLGYLIIISTFQFKADLLYATMTVSALASILVFQLVGVLERYFLPWERKIEL